ncbi:MAG: purine-nucleoside phosphorylase [Bacteroidetes bacterium]|nr:purine-nucleoside phosphorylase [Bacteroidota bacterium]
MNTLQENLSDSIRFIRSKTLSNPTVGIILGSGLGSFADGLEEAVSVPTSQIPNYVRSTVEGHSGELVFGRLGGKEIMAVKGRVHYYEGYSLSQVTYVVRLMAALGIRKMVVTNAAGGLNTSFKPGDLMFITSQINLFFDNPLRGVNDDSIGPRFPDMESDYDREYILLAEQIALNRGIRTQRGVYAAHSGPTYETRAEVRMLQRMGVDAVGMSTIPEVIVAKHGGMRVLGISCITNLGTGISHEKLSHDEVTTTANRVKTQFETLLRDFIDMID